MSRNPSRRYERSQTEVSPAAAWAGYSAFALCMLGSVAWPLWSDNDLWIIRFGLLGAVVIAPVLFLPALRALRETFAPAPSRPGQRQRK